MARAAPERRRDQDRRGRREPGLYREAHIPGAIGFDWRLDLQDQVKRDFLGPEEFGALFGSRGISNDHQVILYGDRNNWSAAYTYWYLKYYGHDNVKLLNGPRERWISEGRPTTVDRPSYPEATFAAEPGDEHPRQARRGLTALDDRASSSTSARRRSSRASSSRAGLQNEGAQRAGHIPGANRSRGPRRSRRTGRSSPPRSSAPVRRQGRPPGEPIIAYCRIGERSAHTWFVLHELLGEPDVRNYDGSWTEWGNIVDVPIEKGSSRARGTARRLRSSSGPIRSNRSDRIRAVAPQIRWSPTR